MTAVYRMMGVALRKKTGRFRYSLVGCKAAQPKHSLVELLLILSGKTT